mmetsp:Transcript_19675/g.54910  ORF Transcript_19675/g.54910 Transcript_19675/m.54910 type:complete len:286 (+) Transcript_19675:1780-2637(+)
MLSCTRVAGHPLGRSNGHARTALDQVLHKLLQLGDRDVGHDHHVCDVILTCELPLAHEGLLQGPLKHHGVAELIQHGLDAHHLQHVLQHVRVAHALLHIPLHALIALTRQRVPQVDGSVAVAAAHDGGVPAVQVLHIGGERHDQLEAGDDDTAGHGGAHKLVPAHGHAADGLAEGDHGGLLQERHHHAKQCAIAVDKEALLREATLLQDVQDLVQVIHCTLHGGADVEVQDGGLVLVGQQVLAQVLVVNLASLQCVHLDGRHAVHAGSLEHRVVALLACVQDAVW